MLTSYFSYSKYHIFILLIICFLQIILADKVDLANYPPEHDIQSYRSLAIAFPHIDETVGRPFIYRLFTPWLVGAIFPNVDKGFLILTALFLVVYVILIYFLLLEYKIPPFVAFYLTIAFIFNRYFVPYCAFEFYRLPDVISSSILVACLILLNRQKYLMILLLSIIGVLTRESAILIIPTGIVYIYLKGNRKDLFIFMGYSVIVSFCFIFPRVMIHDPVGHSLIEAISRGWVKIISPEAIIKQLFIPFNPFFLLPVIQFKEFVEFNKKRPELFIFLVLTLLSTLFGRDTERLMMPYAPIYYLFIASLFQKLYEVSKLNHVKMIVILVISWLSNLYHLWGLIRLPSKIYSIILTFIGSISILFLFIKFKASSEDKKAYVNG